MRISYALLLCIPIGFIFFFWVFGNFRKINKLVNDENKAELTFTYILPIPVLSTFIFMLNIAPFYGYATNQDIFRPLGALISPVI